MIILNPKIGPDGVSSDHSKDRIHNARGAHYVGGGVGRSHDEEQNCPDYVCTKDTYSANTLPPLRRSDQTTWLF